MLKVIVVDDEEKVCALICALVDWNSLDMEVVGIAHNGFDALELIKEKKPDIVISDIRMPGLDGLGLIKSAKKINKDTDFIIISGYKQFEYAQAAIKYNVSDYLLKPIKKSELTSTLKKISAKKNKTKGHGSESVSQFNKIRLGLYTEILFGNKELSNIEDINEKYHYEFGKGFFQCLVVKIDSPNMNIFNSYIQVLRDKIISIVKGLLSSECYDMEFAVKESFVYCIINYDEVKKDGIRKKLRQAMDEINIQNSMFDNIEFSLGLGDVNHKLFSDSIENAEKLVYERLITGTGKIIESMRNASDIIAIDSALKQFDTNLDIVIESLDTEKLSLSFYKFKDSILDAKPSGFCIFNAVKSGYDTFLDKLNKFHNYEKDNQTDIIEMSLASSANALFDMADLQIKKYIEEVAKAKNQESIKPIRIAKQYIHDNYMNPITLEEVSSIVGFNASYFSTLFKKEEGENFLVYISTVRINKAKELLRDTNLNIATICTEVGYTDIRHFTQNFKKYTGIKPNVYRKLYS